MAGAFQSNAFQGNAFQEDATFTGGSGQAQCDIKTQGFGLGQSNCDIKAQGFGLGQSNCDIKTQNFGLGQSQCDIKAINYGFGQANCDIKAVNYGFGQANASILGAIQQYGQANCDIKTQNFGLGQSQCDIKTQNRGFGQAQCYIPIYKFGQAQCDVKTQNRGFGQGQCDVKAKENGFGQAQCKIPTVSTCTPVFNDTYSRTSSGNPGTPDLGPDYEDGATSFYDNVTTDNSKLILTENAADYDYFELDIPIALGDSEIQIDFYLPTYQNFMTIIQLRRIYVFGTGMISFYAADNGTDTTVFLQWFSNSGADNDSTTVNIPRFDTSTWYTAKLQITGDSFRVKFWKVADAEPGTWDAELAGAIGDALLPGDTVTVYADVGEGGSVGSTVSYYDNLMICEMGGITAGYGQTNAYILNGHKHGQAQCKIAEASSCTPVLTDTFSRTFTGDPGTPDLGPSYDDTGPSEEYTFISADGDNLILTGNSDYDSYDIFSPIDIANGEATIDFYMDEVRNWATIFDLIVRGPSVSAITPNIQLYAYFDPDASQFYLYFTNTDNITFTTISLSAATWYTAKFRYDGANVSGKVWERDTAEPDWLITDTTGIINSGILEIYADVGEAGSYPAEFRYDNLTVCEITASAFSGAFGQAQCLVNRGQRFGQAQCFIRKSAGYGQAQADIKAKSNGLGQAKTDIKAITSKFAQAQALILKWAGYGQTQTDIKQSYRGFGQALCLVRTRYAIGLAQCYVHHFRGYAQVQCLINNRIKIGQTQAYLVKYRQNQNAQATCLINSSIKQRCGQAQAYIFNRVSGQAQTRILKLVVKSAQTQVSIQIIFIGAGQAQTSVHVNGLGSGLTQCMVNLRLGTGQAQCSIRMIPTPTFGLTQALIITPGRGNGQALVEIASRSSGQAQCYTKSPISKFGQALCLINKNRILGQAQGYINKLAVKAYGQAQAMLRSKAVLAQAQCRIVLIIPRSGQAQVFINRGTHSGQAQTQIGKSLYPISSQYPVKYNGRVLPGYVQSESYDSAMNIYGAQADYLDLKFAEYTGLQNKVINLKFKVWKDNSFNASKEDTQLAATIVRSNRTGFIPLYIKNMDKHYLALTTKFSTSNDITATHTYDYEVEFECKPWLITDATVTISGTGLINTGLRNLENGGWTPARLHITGTDVTVSGYTEAGDFTGFISISGGVNNLQINSESYSATIAGINRNDVMKNLDYALYVGPGKTYFDINGADDVTIEWEDRHYL